MGMMGDFRRSLNSVRLPLVNAVWSISSAMCSVPSRDENEVRCKLNWWASGSSRQRRKHWLNWPPRTAKYAVRYPEAVRSLVEDEEHLLTFYEFPAAMHRHIQTTNAIESLWSLVRQRTDQIDVFTTETSCLTIVWATIQDIRLHKISV